MKVRKTFQVQLKLRTNSQLRSVANKNSLCLIHFLFAIAKALVKRTRKESQVENLGLLVTPFGLALCALALTCDHFGRDQICTQINASFLPLAQVSSQVQLALLATTCESV